MTHDNDFMTNEQIEMVLGDLQQHICTVLEKADGGARFGADHWDRPGGGGGRTRIIQDGAVLEKGGVGFSAVHGLVSERMRHMLGLGGDSFFASGVSVVMHPRSPLVPIIHMNVRFFRLDTGHYWFGGGIDLTPIYVDVEQAGWFHKQIKALCDRHDPSYYDRFKTWADDYFYIRHRQETRGIGGFFFDRLTEPEKGIDKQLEFMVDTGRTFAATYADLMLINRDKPYVQEQKDWQLLRRGRYAEFNLAIDAGTRFGLETDGRTESILMSLPPMAAWKYDHHPAPGSEEEKTLSYLKKGIDWVNMDVARPGAHHFTQS